MDFEVSHSFATRQHRFDHAVSVARFPGSNCSKGSTLALRERESERGNTESARKREREREAVKWRSSRESRDGARMRGKREVGDGAREGNNISNVSSGAPAAPATNAAALARSHVHVAIILLRLPPTA